MRHLRKTALAVAESRGRHIDSVLIACLRPLSEIVLDLFLEESQPKDLAKERTFEEVLKKTATRHKERTRVCMAG